MAYKVITKPTTETNQEFDEYKIPNLSGDHKKGKRYGTPTNEYDIANKKYVDDKFLVNDANDTTTGTITMAGGIITGDASSADTAYVPMVLYNTDETPPAASGFPIGTIYIQYTA